MPPLARMKIEAMAELGAQLRFAPRPALLRQVERAEALAAEVDPDRAYPEDWIVFRLTGYRPEATEGRVITGMGLLADLSALVEHLCEAAGMTDADVDADALDLDALCSRWGVSRKTVERYRRRGLVARRVSLGGGRRRLVFARRGVEAFEARERGRLDRARGFTRIPEDLDARMIRRAARYRASLGLSLNEAAARLARRFGRSHEGVRQLLRRHDEQSASSPGGAAVFGERGPPDARERELARRASARGVSHEEIGARLGRPAPTVRRAAAERRAELLRALGLEPAPAGPEDVLDSAPARTGLGAPGETTAGAWLEAARVRVVPVAVEERSRAAAYRVLVGRAARVIEGLVPGAVRASDLDRAETDLRWASRLKVALIRTQVPLGVATFEGVAGVGLDRLDPEPFDAALGAIVGGIGAAVDGHDPAHGGRLAAPAGLVLQRAAASWARGVAARPGRAVRRFDPERRIADWTRAVSPWQAWLEPDPRLRGVLEVIDEPDRELLARRHGLGGGPPETLAEVATATGTTPGHAARRVQRALREALGASRAAGARGEAVG